MSDRQVFIGNLCNISNDILRTYCEKYGSLTELSINRDKENNVYHCFAFVTFQKTQSISKFMSSRPHIINGDEIFVKRALPRSTSSIPERLIVTNRLILQDLFTHDKNLLQNYFQKYGRIKKIDVEQGFIDYEDYDDVDRVLLARPHYIRDEEITVTKFAPSEQEQSNNHYHQRSNHRHRSNHQPDRIIHISKTSRKHSATEQNPSENTFVNHVNNDDNVEDGEIHEQNSNIRYERLEEQFQEYKQLKEIEICSLRMDLERTKRQLIDLTQEKLDLLLKNQRIFHNELTLRLFPEQISAQTQTIHDFIPSTSEPTNKKRRLSTTLSIDDREYDYYS
ncbi:hypothetical protein I4U23_010291 [Adineta vaga]|nr:hypothetical protein I4U23_010291 [Adineta vaga]